MFIITFIIFIHRHLCSSKRKEVKSRLKETKAESVSILLLLFFLKEHKNCRNCSQKKSRRNYQKKKKKKEKRKASGISENKDTGFSIFVYSRNEDISLLVHHDTKNKSENSFAYLLQGIAFLGKDQEGFGNKISYEDIVV